MTFLYRHAILAMFSFQKALFPSERTLIMSTANLEKPPTRTETIMSELMSYPVHIRGSQKPDVRGLVSRIASRTKRSTVTAYLADREQYVPVVARQLLASEEDVNAAFDYIALARTL